MMTTTGKPFRFGHVDLTIFVNKHYTELELVIVNYAKRFIRRDLRLQ